MRKKRSIQAGIVALICSTAAVVLGAMPLFEAYHDAYIWILFFGAFGAGASLSNLIRNLRSGKDK